jgi:hypothetical protein
VPFFFKYKSTKNGLSTPPLQQRNETRESGVPHFGNVPQRDLKETLKKTFRFGEIAA